jgi:hypothetical protein
MLQTRNIKEVVEFAISITSRPSSLNYFLVNVKRRCKTKRRETFTWTWPSKGTIPRPSRIFIHVLLGDLAWVMTKENKKIKEHRTSHAILSKKVVEHRLKSRFYSFIFLVTLSIIHSTRTA